MLLTEEVKKYIDELRIAKPPEKSALISKKPVKKNEDTQESEGSTDDNSSTP